MSLLLAAAALTSVGTPPLTAAEPTAVASQALPPGALLQELTAFQTLGRVLYVAAHPDDENTRLLSYFARGRGYRTGYLSLTRGDGGQNLLGTELRDTLGVIRTQELLAARRTDGAIQFFTRANDFGFSKQPDETFGIWNRAEVLADVVRIIRSFRPHVMITRFSTEPGITHGHHTASAILALEAFKLAADPQAFPEQLEQGLKPWKTTRILWNGFPGGFRGGARTEAAPPPSTLQLDTGGYQPLLGESYGEIAARSRSNHKSQGFGTLVSLSPSPEFFQVLAGEPAQRDVMDGVVTSWAAFEGGAAVATAAEQVARDFNPRDPAASVSGLLAVRATVRSLQDRAAPGTDLARTLDEKLQQLDRMIAAGLGLHVQAVAEKAECVPGETVALKLRALQRAAASGVTLRWIRSELPGGIRVEVGKELKPNRPSDAASEFKLPLDTPLSTPYWLREAGTTGMFRVDDPALIGRPENPPLIPVVHVIEIGGQVLRFADQAVEVIEDPIHGEIRQPLVAIPPVTLHFSQELELFAPGDSRAVAVELSANRGPLEGRLSLEVPAGWSVTPATHPFRLDRAGVRQQVGFRVVAPAQPARARLIAQAEVDGRTYRQTRIDIRYDHIPTQLIQPLAQARAVSLELATRGHTIGYLPGAGDLVAESLTRMGYAVTLLTPADLAPGRLKAFDAVVLGVRVANTRTDIGSLMPALFAYAEAGGTVVMQYNTTADLHSTQLAPYPLRISRDRVTDEKAAVTLLTPDHPALTTPNRITAADFEDWVQERGLYFPNEWAAPFTPLLSMADAGEQPKRGSLLVARHGKGYFVYTGLSFFRELPEGVPGAYRLFANLVSLGK